MPLESTSLAVIDLVHPFLKDKAVRLAEMQEIAGEPIRYVQGLRLYADQKKIWDQGRDENGVIIDPKLVVTYARPGHSWHEYALALDAVPLSLIDTPGWSPKSPLWWDYGRRAESLGLSWGGRWTHTKADLPHIQMTGRFSLSPNDEVRATFKNVGIHGVWVEAGLIPPSLRT